jgi:glutaredoxin
VASTPKRVVLFHGQGCSLCDRARSQLDALEVAYEAVDITGDPELEAAHREEIPVVFVAGRKAFKYHVDPAELRRRVGAAGTGADRKT